MPQIYTPHKPTREELMIKRIAELRAIKNLTPGEIEELDVLLNLLGVEN